MSVICRKIQSCQQMTQFFNYNCSLNSSSFFPLPVSLSTPSPFLYLVILSLAAILLLPLPNMVTSLSWYSALSNVNTLTNLSSNVLTGCYLLVLSRQFSKTLFSRNIDSLNRTFYIQEGVKLFL